MADVAAEYNRYKENCAAFELGAGLVKVSGKDSSDFLHRLTTQNVKSMSPGTGLPAALLQANAMLVSIFDLYHCGNFFLLVMDEKHAQITADHLEKLHFVEDLVIENVSSEFRFISLQGPGAKDVLQKSLGRVPGIPGEVLGTEESLITQDSDFGNLGFHLFIKGGRFGEVKERLRVAGAHFCSRELWELLRAESGRPSFGIDVGEKNLILESALSDHVSRNKGCYPGQEVVERVFTYGNVAKKLVGLRWKNSSVLPVSHSKILAQGKEVGEVTSAKLIPWKGEAVAFAMVRRPFYEMGNYVVLADLNVEAEVVPLPHSFEIEKEKPTRDL